MLEAFRLGSFAMEGLAADHQWVVRMLSGLLLVLAGACSNLERFDGVLDGARYTEAALRYELDREATDVSFAVGSTKGRFRAVDAQLAFPEPVAEAAVLEVTIATGSIDLFNPLIESLLKGPDWFAVEAHPEASFRTTSVVQSGADRLAVAGTLTIKGIEQPLELEVAFSGGSLPALAPAADVIPFVATGSFSRAAFGMDGLQSMAPDIVELEVRGALKRAEAVQ